MIFLRNCECTSYTTQQPNTPGIHVHSMQTKAVCSCSANSKKHVGLHNVSMVTIVVLYNNCCTVAVSGGSSGGYVTEMCAVCRFILWLLCRSVTPHCELGPGERERMMMETSIEPCYKVHNLGEFSVAVLCC